MRILFSVPYSTTIDLSAASPTDDPLHLIVRTPDWGLTGFKKRLHHVHESIRILRSAKGYDVLILCTVGIEAFVVARLRKWLAPKLKIIVYDLLMPKPGKLTNSIGHWLRLCDKFAVIRNGDTQTLQRRFNVDPAQCHFIPFYVDPATCSIEAADDGYIYSAGSAHRDWPSLLKALAPLPYKANIAPNSPIELPADLNDRVTLLPMQSAADGRRLMSRARIVIVSMLETDLPSGPLVLLDAMAVGKPIIVTKVNGTIDYVIDGQTALFVPPASPADLSTAIVKLMDNENLRTNLARNAKADVAKRFPLKRALDELIQLAKILAS